VILGSNAIIGIIMRSEIDLARDYVGFKPFRYLSAFKSLSVRIDSL